MWSNHPLNEQAIKREQYADMARGARRAALARAHPPSNTLSRLFRRLVRPEWTRPVAQPVTRPTAFSER